MDALRLPTALLVGFDWGGRGACVVSALWPERVRGLVTAGGYNIQNIAGSVEPAAPEREHRMWYQYYFPTERGRAGLTKNRDAFCKRCGSCGRRPGSSTTRPTSVARHRSTIPISWTS
jgi:pimeloyl-ACP methyl ester carboxylesterase